MIITWVSTAHVFLCNHDKKSQHEVNRPTSRFEREKASDASLYIYKSMQTFTTPLAHGQAQKRRVRVTEAAVGRISMKRQAVN